MAETPLGRLTRDYPKYIDLGTGRVRQALAALGHPEMRLPPVIHVAGTNGKGSTVAFMRSILEAAGLRVHAFTSPHLIHYNERIRVAGSLPDDKTLLAAIVEIEGILDGLPLSWFEMTTVLALYLFAEAQANVVLLETGLGGLCDATNVIDHPAATVITRISYDHTRLLGETIEAIAAHKAGIIKRGAPVIVSYQADARALAMIEKQAASLHAPLFAFGKHWFVSANGAGFTYEDTQGTLNLPSPGLMGQHQYHNAGAAIAALRHCGKFAIVPDQFSAGVTKVEWPGRLQRLTQGPLVALLPAQWELWLDGGHNDSGGEVLALQARKWSDKPLSLVFGMLDSKQPMAFLAPLVLRIARVFTVSIPGDAHSLAAVDCRSAAQRLGMNAQSAESVMDAVKQLACDQLHPQRILICGSLHLAGQVLAENS